MEVCVKWIGNMSFVAETGSGHTVTMDGAPEAGGRNLAARPMEMVLTGLGGCSSFDVVHLLREAGEDIVSVELSLSAVRADTEPKVFTKINGHFIIKGKGISEQQVQQAVTLSAEKLSSVAKMLEHSAELHWDYEIVEV